MYGYEKQENDTLCLENTCKGTDYAGNNKK